MILGATEAEGAVFFDAKVSSFGGLVDEEFSSDQPELFEQGRPCGVLGAAQWRNIGPSQVTSDTQYPMFEGLLRYLVRTYPHGQIFNFDQDTPPLVQDVMNKAEAFVPTASLLREVFPRARRIVLYPLWDGHRDRYFAM